MKSVSPTYTSMTCSFASLVGHQELNNCEELQWSILGHINSILEKAVSEPCFGERRVHTCNVSLLLQRPVISYGLEGTSLAIPSG